MCGAEGLACATPTISLLGGFLSPWNPPSHVLPLCPSLLLFLCPSVSVICLFAALSFVPDDPFKVSGQL